MVSFRLGSRDFPRGRDWQKQPGVLVLAVAEGKMAKKEFRAPKFQDFEIVEDGVVVGALRVKPSGVLWAPKGSHDWYGLTLKQVADLAESSGKKQKK